MSPDGFANNVAAVPTRLWSSGRRVEQFSDQATLERGGILLLKVTQKFDFPFGHIGFD